LEKSDFDIVCLQETKVTQEQLSPEQLLPFEYRSLWYSAEKAGYSGLGIYYKRAPLSIELGLGDSEIDKEARVILAEYPDFVLINSYFPNSQRDHARLPFKLKFCNLMTDTMVKYVQAGKNIILCGDLNIAHKEIDLKNPKTNQDNAGFLPEERASMDKLLASGFVDIFREFNQQEGQYTWWSYRPGVREKNVGWRLDYFIVNRDLAPQIKRAWIEPDVLGSDHCPVGIEMA
jgi:exodeoxyribonuclease-3